MIDYKQKCLDIYYASDVCDKTLSFGCEVSLHNNHSDNEYLGKAHFTQHSTYIDAICTESYVDVPKYDYIVKGHPPTLASWLRLVMKKSNIKAELNRSWVTISTIDMGLTLFRLKLTTEEPTDWEALYNVIKDV